MIGPPHEGFDEPSLSFGLDGFQAKVTMLCAGAAGGLGLLVAYIMWLSRGCVFTPYISDLGLRPPEQTVLQSTMTLVIPAIVLVLASQSARQYTELKKQGTSTALWHATVAAGIVAIVGVFVAGFCPWDGLFHTHVVGAIAFFTGMLIYVVGVVGVWTQLGQRVGPRGSAIGLVTVWQQPAEGHVRWTLYLVEVGLVAATIGITLFIKYGPVAPCPPGVKPVNGNCVANKKMETFFEDLCAGDAHSHKHLGGNIAAIFEWTVFACVILACVNIGQHGTNKPWSQHRGAATPLMASVPQSTRRNSERRNSERPFLPGNPRIAERV